MTAGWATANLLVADARSVEYLVTLVHGTFATDAPWMRANSTLSKTLGQRLGAGLTLVPFDWSGRNSPTVRLAAADCLATRLERHCANIPTQSTTSSATATAAPSPCGPR
jgi:hypothetical protein